MPKRAMRQIRIEGDIAYVPLTRGHHAVIDARDVHLVEGPAWKAFERCRPNGDLRTVYAARTERAPGNKWRMIFMHRVIADTPADLDADHRDGDGLNNRRENLRNVSRAQNIRNQRLRTGNTSGVKGVSWNKQKAKWCAHIGLNGKKRYLGAFDSIEDAASAYSKASAELHGEFGRTD